MPETKVQSIGFVKPYWDSKFKREQWLRSHGYKNSKVDEKDTSYRYRQYEPELAKSYTTKVLNNHIFLVIGHM